MDRAYYAELCGEIAEIRLKIDDPRTPRRDKDRLQAEFDKKTALADNFEEVYGDTDNSPNSFLPI